MDSQMVAAFDDLIEEVRDAVGFLRAHPFYAEPENRATAHMFLVGMLLARLEDDVIFDPDFPTFRILDTRIREGGDNPDQRYLMSHLTGGATYRIWGTLGSLRRLDLQIYAGDPFVAGSGGRSAGFLAFEDLAVNDDGGFEVLASPDRRDGNWLENPSDGTQILVRQIFSDWENETPGEVHIDRVGNEGALKPVLTEENLAERLRRAAHDLRVHVHVWPGMVEARYFAGGPNWISPPADPGAGGGVPGRWMCGGNFDLRTGEALVVRTWPADGNYQGIQLADLWFSSLEYGNRQTSLTGDQAHLGSDGAYMFVICDEDPGVANWLDTCGRRRGTVLLRFDGASAASFEGGREPTATVVPFADLAGFLPEDTATVSPVERAQQIGARRRHVQRRFGY